MKDKKAILKEETLKLLIAVIALILLVYLAVQLYGIFIAKPEIEKARSTFDALSSKIQALDNGAVEYTVTNPEGWYIVAYNKELVDKDETRAMPEKCEEKDCLCICPTEKGGLAETAIRLENMQYDPLDEKRWADYFYREIGVQLCEQQGMCENFEGVRIIELEKYGVVTALEKTYEVNWISLWYLPRDIQIVQDDGKIFVRKK